MVRYSFFQILSKANKDFSKNFKKAFKIYLIVLVITLIINFLSKLIENFILVNYNNVANYSSLELLGLLLLVGLILSITNFLIYLFLKMYLYKLFYKNEAKKVTIKFKELINFCCVYMLFGLMIGLLFLLFILPGIIFSIY